MNFSKLNCVCSLIIYRNIINICTKNINCSVLSNLSIQLPLKDSNFFRNKRSFRSNENTEVNIHTYANKIYSVGSNGKWIARRNARNYAFCVSCFPRPCHVLQSSGLLHLRMRVSRATIDFITDRGVGASFCLYLRASRTHIVCWNRGIYVLRAYQRFNKNVWMHVKHTDTNAYTHIEIIIIDLY